MSVDVRKWLDRYDAEVGYGCLYCEDISVAAGCVSMRAVKYSNQKDRLFNEEDFYNVVESIREAVQDVKEKHLGDEYTEVYGKDKGKIKDNIITHIILHGGRATGGFGIWVIRMISPELEKMMDSDNPFVVGMAMM